MPVHPSDPLLKRVSTAVYSEAAQYYVEETVPSSGIDQGRFDRSKKREKKYNESWKERPVNLNEICDKFAPGNVGCKEGVKFVFNGDDYKVVADMASGYLRIQDLNTGKYVTLDGVPGTLEETHFKILRREEMWMAFYLVKSLAHVNYYGNVPEPVLGHEDAFEEGMLNHSDIKAPNVDFVDSVNDRCGTLLDLSDVDFFDANKCRVLVAWLDERLESSPGEALEPLYRKLREYAYRAIELGAGVIVEL